jgi:hypothetical protein
MATADRMAAVAKSFTLVISILRKNLAGRDKFGRCWLSFSAKRREKLREISHTTPIFGL